MIMRATQAHTRSIRVLFGLDDAHWRAFHVHHGALHTIQQGRHRCSRYNRMFCSHRDDNGAYILRCFRSNNLLATPTNQCNPILTLAIHEPQHDSKSNVNPHLAVVLAISQRVHVIPAYRGHCRHTIVTMTHLGRTHMHTHTPSMDSALE